MTDATDQALLRQRVELLEARCDRLTQVLSQTVAAQRSLQRSPYRSSPFPPDRPVDASTLGDGWHAEATRAGGSDNAPAFGEWVLWLVDSYELWDEWPRCWFQHAGLVEELRSLWVFRRALDTELADKGQAAFAWHDAFWRFRVRALNGITKRCLSKHEPPSDRTVKARDDEVASMRAGHAEMLHRLRIPSQRPRLQNPRT